MLHRVKHILSVLGFLLIITSCDRTIHEYPTDPTIVLNLSFEIDNAAPEEFVVVKPGNDSGTSYIVRTQGAGIKNTRFDEPVKLRYIVDLYRVISSRSEFVRRDIRLADPTQPIPENVVYSLEAAEYKVLVWCDYVRASAPDESWYYNTDDLRNIRYSDIEVKDNNDKDVFSTMLNLNFREYSYSTQDFKIDKHLVLERPKGRYRCVTTDCDRETLIKMGINNITTITSYVLWVADGYNVEEQMPNHFDETRGFYSVASVDDIKPDGTLEMCYDYVFVNGKQTNVRLNFDFYKGILTKGADGKYYNEDGSLTTEDDKITTWTGIIVPLKRNMETVIEANFLKRSVGSGGIGIDPGFEDEIVIHWP